MFLCSLTAQASRSMRRTKNRTLTDALGSMLMTHLCRTSSAFKLVCNVSSSFTGLRASCIYVWHKAVAGNQKHTWKHLAQALQVSPAVLEYSFTLNTGVVLSNGRCWSALLKVQRRQYVLKKSDGTQLFSFACQQQAKTTEAISTM